MPYSIDLSGALLCYGPLAVMIIGFIAFAWITDADARRSYLRRIDMRPETEAPEVLPPVVTTRTRAQTPSGAWVTIIPPGAEANGNGGAVKFDPPAAPPAAPAKPAAPPVAEPEPVTAPQAAAEPVAESEPEPVQEPDDDLTFLAGVGPQIEQALKTAGLNTYAKIAAASEDDLRAALSAAGITLAPNLSTWSGQAAELAK